MFTKRAIRKWELKIPGAGCAQRFGTGVGNQDIPVIQTVIKKLNQLERCDDSYEKGLYAAC